MKHTILISIFLFFGLQMAAQEKNLSKQYTFTKQMLTPGIYNFSKVPKPEHKTYYDEDANREWTKRLKSDEKLKDSGVVGNYQQREDGTTEFFTEWDVLIYSKDLEYVYLWSGAGCGFSLDLKTLEEVPYDYSSIRYSPNKAFRYVRVFASQTEAEFSHHIEVLVDGEYIPYQFAKSFGDEQLIGAYWHDDNTLYYLYKHQYDSPYWIGHSVRIEKK